MKTEDIARTYIFMAETIFPVLSASEQAILNQLFLRSIMSGSDTFSMDLQQLSRMSGLSLIALRKAVASLQEKGYIVILRKGSSHRATEYRIVLGEQVVQQKAVHPESVNAKSKMIGLEFPYDWSNSDISDEVLIDSVLRKSRFMDILKLCSFYGIDKVESIADKIPDRQKLVEVKGILSNIRVGRRKALYEQADVA